MRANVQTASRRAEAGAARRSTAATGSTAGPPIFASCAIARARTAGRASSTNAASCGAAEAAHLMFAPRGSAMRAAPLRFTR